MFHISDVDNTRSIEIKLTKEDLAELESGISATEVQAIGADAVIEA